MLNEYKEDENIEKLRRCTPLLKFESNINSNQNNNISDC